MERSSIPRSATAAGCRHRIKCAAWRCGGPVVRGRRSGSRGVGSLRGMTAPRVAVGPCRPASPPTRWWPAAARVVEIDDNPEALVWLDPSESRAWPTSCRSAPDLRWVQLPFAGIERVADVGLLDHDRIWTCAKGSYAEPVAEHALTLSLAGLRHLPDQGRRPLLGRPRRDQPLRPDGSPSSAAAASPRSCSSSWLRSGCRPRWSGGVRPPPRRGPDGAGPRARTRCCPDRWSCFWPWPSRRRPVHIIGAPSSPHGRDAVAGQRGPGPSCRHRRPGGGLGAESIAGAALDVTDPEPLPDGHPLWDLPCLITPHTADTFDMVMPHLAERIRINVVRFAPGRV